MIPPKLKTAIAFVAMLLGANMAFGQQTNNSQAADPFPSNNEFRSWSIGLDGGLMSQYTVFLGSSDFKTAAQSAGYGLYVKKQIVPVLGI